MSRVWPLSVFWKFRAIMLVQCKLVIVLSRNGQGVGMPVGVAAIPAHGWPKCTIGGEEQRSLHVAFARPLLYCLTT